MKKRKIDETIRSSGCIQGGIKEACLKIRETISKSVVRKDSLYIGSSEVDIDEFMQSVKILLAFASGKPDEEVELYYCSGDCAKYYDVHCDGEMKLSCHSTKLCPRYVKRDM